MILWNNNNNIPSELYKIRSELFNILANLINVNNILKFCLKTPSYYLKIESLDNKKEKEDFQSELAATQVSSSPEANMTLNPFRQTSTQGWLDINGDSCTRYTVFGTIWSCSRRL